MARIGHERYREGLSVTALELAARAVMVLHVAGATARRQRLLYLAAALELCQEGLV